MSYACVRESMRARDIDMTCEHSCRNAYVIAQCVCECSIMALHVHLGDEWSL